MRRVLHVVYVPLILGLLVAGLGFVMFYGFLKDVPQERADCLWYFVGPVIGTVTFVFLIPFHIRPGPH